TPCWARNIAVDRPTKAPPAMRTRASKSFVAIVLLPDYAAGALSECRRRFDHVLHFGAEHGNVARCVPAEPAGRRYPKPLLAHETRTHRATQLVSSPTILPHPAMRSRSFFTGSG